MTWLHRGHLFWSDSSGRFDVLFSEWRRVFVAIDHDRPKVTDHENWCEAKAWCDAAELVRGRPMAGSHKKRGLCLHCLKPSVLVGRALCSNCYRKPQVKRLYPTLNNSGRRSDRGDRMTEEQLDALIAKWLPSMPGNDEPVARGDPEPPPIVKRLNEARRWGRR